MMFQNQACPTQNRTGDHISFSRKLKLSHICWMLKVKAKYAVFRAKYAEIKRGCINIDIFLGTVILVYFT